MKRSERAKNKKLAALKNEARECGWVIYPPNSNDSRTYCSHVIFVGVKLDTHDMSEVTCSFKSILVYESSLL